MKNKKNISYEEEIKEAKERKKKEKEEKEIEMANDFAFLDDKTQEKENKVKNEKVTIKKEIEKKKKSKEKTIEFRGEEITISDKDHLLKENKKEEKSKLNIFFLILALIVILGYGYYIYTTLDFNNLEIIDIVKSCSFVLIALVVILILFKINTKKSTPYIIFLTLILIGYSLFDYSYAKEVDVYVSDFINHSYSEVLTWADKYHITLSTLHEYSDTIEENHIIMQEYGITTLVSEIDSFTVTISDGPNPDKEIIVPNLTGFTYDDVMKYIKENHLFNVEIEFLISDKTRDTVVEQIGSGSMKRNDLVKFIFSYGEEIEQTEVNDLKGLSLFEATSSLKRNGLNYEIQYEFSNSVNKNYVISQEVIKDEDEKIKLIISKGKEIVVPNIDKMSTTEITKWATENNIKLKYEEVYNKEYESGKVIKASINENDKIEEGSEVVITISKGSLVMPKTTNLNELKMWATENNIPYEESYEFSTTIKNGEIIKISPLDGTKLTENDTIIVTVSKGKSVTVPNLVGLTKNEITNKCNNIGLTCTFKYGGLTEGTKKDVSISQSKKSGITVGEGTNVTITLSSGIVEKVNVPSFSGKSKSEINSTCSNIGVTCNFTYNNTYSSTAKDIAISQDKTGMVNKGSTITITLSIGSAKSFTIVIDGSLLSLGNPEQTKNTLKKKLEDACPGVIFKFSFKAVNSGIGYLNPGSDVKVGSNTFTQGKTYNVIINSSN